MTVQRLRDAAKEIARWAYGHESGLDAYAQKSRFAKLEEYALCVLERETKLAAPAEVTAEQLCEVFVEMSDGIMWKEPEADGHFYRAAKKLNALLAAAKGGRGNE